MSETPDPLPLELRNQYAQFIKKEIWPCAENKDCPDFVKGEGTSGSHNWVLGHYPASKENPDDGGYVLRVPRHIMASKTEPDPEVAQFLAAFIFMRSKLNEKTFHYPEVVRCHLSTNCSIGSPFTVQKIREGEPLIKVLKGLIRMKDQVVSMNTREHIVEQYCDFLKNLLKHRSSVPGMITAGGKTVNKFMKWDPSGRGDLKDLDLNDIFITPFENKQPTRLVDAYYDETVSGKEKAKETAYELLQRLMLQRHRQKPSVDLQKTLHEMQQHGCFNYFSEATWFPEKPCEKVPPRVSDYPFVLEHTDFETQNILVNYDRKAQKCTFTGVLDWDGLRFVPLPLMGATRICCLWEDEENVDRRRRLVDVARKALGEELFFKMERGLELNRYKEAEFKSMPRGERRDILENKKAAAVRWAWRWATSDWGRPELISRFWNEFKTLRKMHDEPTN